MIKYVIGDYQSPNSYSVLKDRILLLKNSVAFDTLNNQQLQTFPFVFYLAVPPSVFLTVASYIHEYILPYLSISPSSSKFRIVVEKPFGWDLNSSDELSEGLSKLFIESQVSNLYKSYFLAISDGSLFGKRNG